MKKHRPSGSLSIPIIVDDVKKAKGFQMSRCAYLSIEFEGPYDDWELELDSLSIPVIMMELSAIIYRPFPRGTLFNSPQKLDDLYEFVESDGQFFIDRNSLWFPNSLLENPARGHVYRVSSSLFTGALWYDSGKISREDFLNSCKERKEEARFSESETDALHKWTQYQLEMSKLNYEGKKALALQYGKG
jgi:hypothetical protein